ncbi:spermidine synthase [Saccharopolyspora sp. NFXS83]|uniref:spermidine synthase n=1 Tax=Saccharopolyspora sp. NFXS83 TaxID=2993560 RepID=UPI00224A80AD|nr:spermidine synthase [Saccharopolyspora sp. NFXS83]MCX2729806.1 spermidine synthase [Saccharopolyspora sp. NFXS83]
MGRRFEELDWQDTPIGEVSLRRRLDPALGVDVYEVKLGDEFLMSSVFTVAEEELARLGLAAVTGSDLDVLVGGLGLGCTAQAALADERVRSLEVVEALGAVIDWHRRELLPLGHELNSDARVRFEHRDFFAWAAEPPQRRYHAILLDIDHSPTNVLDTGHAGFYRPSGLRLLAEHLERDGVFALWSDDPPSEEFTAALAEVFATVRAHVVDFDNPYGGPRGSNTVYVARN